MATREEKIAAVAEVLMAEENQIGTGYEWHDYDQDESVVEGTEFEPFSNNPEGANRVAAQVVSALEAL